MKKVLIIFLVLFIVTAIVISGCKKEPMVDPDPGTDPTGLTFLEVINSGGSIETPTVSESADTTAVDNNLPIGDGTYNCTTITYDVNAAYGGDAASTFNALGVADIHSLKDVLKQSTSLESAKPLSYVVRNVSNNQIVATQLATRYDVVECEQVGTVGTLPSIAHWTNHPALNELGPITAAYANDLDHFILINEQGDWVRSTVQANGEGLLEGPFPWGEDLPFTTVGATTLTDGHPTLYVFNGAGNKWASLKNGVWMEPKDISEFLYGGCPFINTGIGAMSNLGYKAFDVDNPFDPHAESYFMFDNTGENYVQAGESVEPGHPHFYGVQDLQTGFGLGGKIDAVGAAIGYDNGGSSGTTRVHILFDQSGTQYVVWGDFGNGTEVIGPFGI